LVNYDQTQLRCFPLIQITDYTDKFQYFVTDFRINYLMFMDGFLPQENSRSERQLVKNLDDLDRLNPTPSLLEWNDTLTADAAAGCIHQLFEANVELYPDHLAVVSITEQLTYRELNDRANRLAVHLVGLGVKPDMLVGISVERSIEMVVGLLGILKAGGAYVPLDPDYPHDRLSFIINDAAMTVLVTQSQLVAKLPAHQATIVCIDRLGSALLYETLCERDQDLPADSESQLVPNLNIGVQPQHLAYAMYTSGSTGQPKGVLIEHRSLVNYAIAANAEYAMTSADRVLQFASLNFDISAEEIYTALTSGATLVLRTAETIDIGTFLRHCREWQITMVSLPTAYWHELTIRLETDRLQLPPSLRLTIIGGEKAAIARFRAWQQVVGQQVRLINTYGPTEATIITLCTDLSELDVDQDRLEVPIGRPLANVQVYILDLDLQPVPIGAPGELYIGGAALARSYLNRPERTASRFIPNPFSEAFSGRLYKTGDLVRARADGNIEFISRIDRQVKIRGFRVELTEVEMVIDRHPSIAQTVVIAREDRPGDKKLVAYCVADTRAAPPSISDLRHFVAETLPDYMVPGMFVLLAALPMTVNGKVDLAALPTPVDIRQDADTTFVAPQDQIELELTKIWQQLLGQQSIGINDNFFELGGHSLLAMRLFNQIEQIWDKSLPLATLLQAQTIEQLAQIIRQAADFAPWSSLVMIQTGITAKPPLFCIHPIGGNVLEYYPLATYLGNQRAIYGLQSQGLDGLQPPLNRIEDMASKYIQEMLTVTPDGPYLLIGYSFGGSIAFEIASQLHAQGKQVDFLGLLDIPAPQTPPLRPSLLKALPIHVSNLWQLNWQERIKYITDRFDYRFNKVDPREFLIRELSNLNPSPHLLNIINSNFQADHDYYPQVYTGDMYVFRCQVQSMQYALYKDLGWSDLVNGNVSVLNITGNHYSLLKEPNVGFLAENLKLCIERSQL
jgi:amino acid adenylation domain-containing protein